RSGCCFGRAASPLAQAEPGAGPAFGRRNARYRGIPGSFRPRQRAPDRALRPPHRRHFLDRGPCESQCVRSGRAARMGTGPRTCSLYDRHVRRDDGRKRTLGKSGWTIWAPHRPSRRGSRGGSDDSTDFAVRAADGAVVMIPLTWQWKLQTGDDLDLGPSLHWPSPVTAQDIEHDRGPVMVTVEYRIDPKYREPFLAALETLGHERRRDGAYAWGVFEDAAAVGRFVETFFVESWVEHLRQHERVTNADRLLQGDVTRFQLVGEPAVSHLIAARPAGSPARKSIEPQ